jgi:uncharacterized membrane protein
MEHSKHRFEYFSDIIMAILMTVLIFKMPVPEKFSLKNIMQSLGPIRIFLITFIVIGSFWNRHHRLIDRVEKVTNKLIWRNLIFLFSLALMPIFAQWILVDQNNIALVIGYDIIFILVNLIYFFMIKCIYGKDKINESPEIKYLIKFFLKYLFINIIIVVLIIALAVIFPNIKMVLYLSLLFPAISSRINLFVITHKYKKIKNKNTTIDNKNIEELK